VYANALVSLVPVCSRERGGERDSDIADYTRVKTETKGNGEIN